MTTQTPTLSPAQQVANIARALLTEAERAPFNGQLANLRTIARQLAQATAAQAAGTLAPVEQDGLPF